MIRILFRMDFFSFEIRLNIFKYCGLSDSPPSQAENPVALIFILFRLLDLVKCESFLASRV